MILATNPCGYHDENYLCQSEYLDCKLSDQE
jgi:hypothetical protein